MEGGHNRVTGLHGLESDQPLFTTNLTDDDLFWSLTQCSLEEVKHSDTAVAFTGFRLPYNLSQPVRVRDLHFSGAHGRGYTLLKQVRVVHTGEDEAEFLTREAAVLAEQYQAEYEQKIESLRKWTDAYAALTVSAGLIVVISMISMMIWKARE